VPVTEITHWCQLVLLVIILIIVNICQHSFIISVIYFCHFTMCFSQYQPQVVHKGFVIELCVRYHLLCILSVVKKVTFQTLKVIIMLVRLKYIKHVCCKTFLYTTIRILMGYFLHIIVKMIKVKVIGLLYMILKVKQVKAVVVNAGLVRIFYKIWSVQSNRRYIQDLI
jgi:hypothetical protein